MQKHKLLYPFLIQLYFRLLLVDDQDKGDTGDKDDNPTPTDTGDKPAPQGQGDIEVKGGRYER